MAADVSILFARAFPFAEERSHEISDMKLISALRKGAEILIEMRAEVNVYSALSETSDTVRGWQALSIGARPELCLSQKMNLLIPFAEDPHFAVREWAWLAVRDEIVRSPEAALPVLYEYTAFDSAFVRRFACEASRPRSVWGRHIARFKSQPEICERFLEPLWEDDSTYVQKSLGNWINDAAATRPEWAKAYAESRRTAYRCAGANRIASLAMRNLRK